MNNSLFDKLRNRLTDMIPSADEFRQDSKAKFEGTLKHKLRDLDVLTREDFEAQVRTLDRARQRVSELESIIKDLESRINRLERGLEE